MKLFIVLAAITLAQAGRLDRVYLPPNARSSRSSNILQAPHHSLNQGPAGQLNRAYLPPHAGGNAPRSQAPRSDRVYLPPFAKKSVNSQNFQQTSQVARSERVYLPPQANFQKASQAPRADRVYLPPHAQSSLDSARFQQSSQAAQAQRVYLPPQANFQKTSQAARAERVYLPPHAQSSLESKNFHQSQNSISSAQTRVYLPPNGKASAGFDNFHQASHSTNDFTQNSFSSFESRPERAQAALERSAAILRDDKSNDGDAYSFAYETQNGIYAEENGVATNGVQAQGGYSYTGDDGKVYSVRYTADENGFVPQGDHLPTPPPIPEEILKALEQNARDEAAGIYDDGTYNAGKYADASDNQQQHYNNNAQPINYNEDSVVTTSAVARHGGQTSASLQKTYLPPHVNNQRNQFNARDGYRY